jgi:hypothetical protein
MQPVVLKALPNKLLAALPPYVVPIRRMGNAVDSCGNASSGPAKIPQHGVRQEMEQAASSRHPVTATIPETIMSSLIVL